MPWLGCWPSPCAVAVQMSAVGSYYLYWAQQTSCCFWHLLCIFCIGSKKLAIVLLSFINHKLFESKKHHGKQVRCMPSLPRHGPNISMETLMGLESCRPFQRLFVLVLRQFLNWLSEQSGHFGTDFVCTKSLELGRTSMCSYLQVWNYKDLHYLVHGLSCCMCNLVSSVLPETNPFWPIHVTGPQAPANP